MTFSEWMTIINTIILVLIAGIGGLWSWARSHEIERLKTSLTIGVNKAHVLQPHIISAALTMHSKIYDFLSAAEHYVSPIIWAGQTGRRERIDAVAKAAAELHQYIQTHKLYFDEDLTAKVHDLFQFVHEALIEFSTYEGLGDLANPQMVEEKRRAVWDLIQKDVPPRLAKIREEFQTVMGVKTNGV